MKGGLRIFFSRMIAANQPVYCYQKTGGLNDFFGTIHPIKSPFSFLVGFVTVFNPVVKTWAHAVDHPGFYKFQNEKVCEPFEYRFFHSMRGLTVLCYDSFIDHA